MAPSIPTLFLEAPSKQLPTCAPNLMPFHIDYNGKAEIDTYFKVKPAKPKVAVALTAASDAPKDTAAAMAVDEEASVVAGPSQQRFVSTFRGRTVQGLSVDLPEGYRGVVLRAEGMPEEHKSPKATPSKPVSKPVQSKGRATRGSTRAMKVDEPEEEVTLDDDEQDEGPTGDVRKLHPTAVFSSFVAWNADIPVNEASDDYLRSLTEWTALAAQIHQEED